MTTVRLASGVMLRYTLDRGKWALLVIALVWAASAFTVASLSPPGEATISIWATIIWVLHWAAFPGGIAVGFCVPILVAHGLTRRSAIVGGVTAVLALAFGTALIVQTGLTVEWLIYRSRGMPHPVGGAHLFDSASQVHVVLAEYGLNLASVLVSGLLMFLVFYRFGWRGTFVVPLSLVPPAVAWTALIAGSVGPVDPDSPGWVASIGPGTALTLALVAVAGGLLAAAALIRTIPIRSK